MLHLCGAGSPSGKARPMLGSADREQQMGADTVSTSELKITAGGVVLAATFSRPKHCGGVVVFAHGSGSSRFSPRNREVAASLQAAGLATLLLDLLTPEEEQADAATRRWRFDIPLLADRLTGAIDWLIFPNQQHQLEALNPEPPATGESLSGLPLGLFGASTGAAAALITAAARPAAVGAVVCRGGRPDLAPAALPHVRCPTLFIVGGADREVLALNRQAASAMTAPHHLSVVVGATHLFGEEGALEAVCVLARDWFQTHLCPSVLDASPLP
jgi:putative phosphoribosyl transferase